MDRSTLTPHPLTAPINSRGSLIVAKSPEKLTRHQVMLFEGDLDRLSDIYRRRRATEVIRILVRRHLSEVDSRYRERLANQPRLDPITLEEIES
jgi:hypothetical protein